MNIDTQSHGEQGRGPYVRLPPWLSVPGVVFFGGSAILIGRLIWEETVWTWERGPQMVGFSLAHSGGAILFFFPFLLFFWLIAVFALSVLSAVRHRRISKARWAGLGVSALLLVLGSLPEVFWQRAFVGRMAASPHSGDLLFYAACRGDLETVQGFIGSGVPVNTTHRAYQKSALHCAASGGHSQIVRYLVSRGADINAVDRAGDSPLELAMSNNQNATTKLLVELGGKRIHGNEEQRRKAIRDQAQEATEGLRNR